MNFDDEVANENAIFDETVIDKGWFDPDLIEPEPPAEPQPRRIFIT